MPSSLDITWNTLFDFGSASLFLCDAVPQQKFYFKVTLILNKMPVLVTDCL